MPDSLSEEKSLGKWKKTPKDVTNLMRKGNNQSVVFRFPLLSLCSGPFGNNKTTKDDMVGNCNEHLVSKKTQPGSMPKQRDRKW